ncbi:MAG TPA: hypothetical protein VFS23_25615 [Vicinamibacterales bacterium]|nr:hypothetical protein [Vicinamibacterales bacterium]
MKNPKMIAIAAIAGISLLSAPLAAGPQNTDDKKKPKITVRASPQAGFSPLRIVLTAELKGGDNDYSEFYCPTVEWIWGDDTRAQSTGDCDPYEPGKSEIQRRYTISRVFNTSGEYRVEFRLKQKDKYVGSGSILVRVQPGVRDGGGLQNP